MTHAQLIALRARAEHRAVDLGTGGCETFVSGDEIVLNRDTVVELCQLALGNASVRPEPPRRIVLREQLDSLCERCQERCPHRSESSESPTEIDSDNSDDARKTGDLTPEPQKP